MFDEFDSHVTDWLAQLPKNHERNRDERDMGEWFVALCKMDDDEAEIKRLKAALEHKALAQPEPPAPPVVAASAPDGMVIDQAGPVKAVTEEAPASEPPKRRRTWWAVTSQYIVCAEKLLTC